jgi:hypothetical protein
MHSAFRLGRVFFQGGRGDIFGCANSGQKVTQFRLRVWPLFGHGIIDVLAYLGNELLTSRPW